MELHNEKRNITKVGLSNQSNFTIKASAKAFQVLSSGLYSNKIRAIIRELSCNAYDAHVAAGTAENPFKIHLPTPIEPFFSVVDYGIGLSHDDVLNLYTTYFDSTKNESNDYIGALGLGSKSPFSYTDQFIVNSNFDGIKHCYAAFIDDNGSPSITLLTTQPTDEHNGLEVIVGVTNKNDHNRFKEEAQSVFRDFATRPTVNMELQYTEDKTPLFSADTWKMYEKKGYRSSDCSVIMGNVRYPLDATSFAVDDDDDEQGNLVYEILSNEHIDFTVPIGTADVSASRESLSYDKQTITNIRTLVLEVADNMFTEMEKTISQCKTYRDAVTTAYNIAEKHSRFLKSKKGKNEKVGERVFYRRDTETELKYKKRIVGWNNIPQVLQVVYPGVSDWEGHRISSDIRVATVRHVGRRYSWSERFSIVSANKWFDDNTIAPNRPVSIFIKDESKGYRQRLETWYNKNVSNGNIEKNHVFIIIPDEDKQTKKFSKLMSGLKAIKVSTLPKPTRTATVGSSYATEARMVEEYNHTNKSWEQLTLERGGAKKLSGIVIPQFRDKSMITRNGRLVEEERSASYLIDRAKEIGLLTNKDRIFRMKLRFYDDVINPTGKTKNIAEVVASRVTKAMKDKYARKWATIGGTDMDYDHNSRTLAAIQTLSKHLDPNHEVQVILDLKHQVAQQTRERGLIETEIRGVEEILELFNIEDFRQYVRDSKNVKDSQSAGAQLQQKMDEFFVKYPMIAHTNGLKSYYSSFDDAELKDVVNYIKTMDNILQMYSKKPTVKTAQQAAAA